MANGSDNKILDQKYEILELIGSGGMAYVYKARDIETDELVAIKVLKREYCEDKEYIRKFNNEANAVTDLNHKNIVRIYSVGNTGNVHYIVREYVEGITLKDYVEKKATIPWNEAISIAHQLLEAVEAAHAKHVIHRDIKPMNILLTKDGTVKLSDFGIARAVSDSTIQATKNSVGSVHYIAPEQAKSGVVDERSDIYSIGVTLYEMIVGAVPFDGDSHVSIALKHLSGSYVPPSEADPDIPKGINDFIVMALMKNVGDRFQSATEMLQCLERVSENPDEGFLVPVAEADDSDMKIVGEDKSVIIPEMADDNTQQKTAGEISNPEDNIEISVKGPEEKKPKFEKGAIKDGIFKGVAYLIGLAVSALLVWFIISTVSYVVNNSFILSKATYTLENYVGYEAVEIVEMLEKEKIFVKQELVIDENYLGAGYIISQEPASGKIMRKGDVVTFKVSAVEGSFLVPDVTGKTKDEAVKEFTDLGMVTEIVTVKSNEVNKNIVLKTIPSADAVVTKDDPMTIYVSEGALYETVTVPDLEGMTLSEATAELKALGLKVGNSCPEPGQNLTFILNPTPSPIPTLAPTAKPTPKPTPEPTDAPATGENNEESDENPEEGEETPVPTEEPTPEPTEKPVITPSPIPTISPKDYVFASRTVVYQYPAAGTVLYKNETVDLYFYDIVNPVRDKNNELTTIREYKTVVIPEPDIAGNKGQISFRITARPNDTGKLETVYDPKTPIYTSLFPLTVKIPVSYNGGTTVSVFVDNELYYQYVSK